MNVLLKLTIMLMVTGGGLYQLRAYLLSGGRNNIGGGVLVGGLILGTAYLLFYVIA
jgi:hypothetical protein